MANAFKNYTATDVGIVGTLAYTVPADTTAVMIGCNLANTTSDAIVVDVECANAYLVKSVSIPTGSALSVLDGKVILEAGDTVVVTSDNATSCDVILSVLEQT